MNTKSTTLRSIHPFPARMAPSIIQTRLRKPPAMCVVDPMAGSGTTIVAARLRGHEAFGFDTDPLALLIAKAWSCDIKPERLRSLAEKTLTNARGRYHSLNTARAYPKGADRETCDFVRYWFDSTNRRQLAALSASIAKIKDLDAQAILWCAFSRMIITKGAGVSLAIDVSHSRPHRVYKTALMKPFDRFLPAVEHVLRAAHFTSGQRLPAADIKHGDARSIPLKNGIADLVITSPPYLNAIDYLRGHKLSLVWMGHQISNLRELRSANIGSERFHGSISATVYRDTAEKVVQNFADLPLRSQSMLIQYFADMDRVLAEISRILKRSGKAVLVVGNSMIRGIFINNSKLLTRLARANGLGLISARKRQLEENRRYLPPPGNATSGTKLRSRMNEEVILTFRKLPALLSGVHR
jgi:SAM-dependent methyltransferase